MENSISTYEIQTGLVVYQRIIEYQVGMDLKVHLVQISWLKYGLGKMALYPVELNLRSVQC